MSRNPDFLLILALESSSGNCNLLYCGQRASPDIGGVCTAAPPAANSVAGLEQGKAGLRARGAHRELVGMLGSPPQGTTWCLVGEPVILLHCTGHHPAPPWPSLPLLPRDLSCQMLSPVSAAASVEALSSLPKMCWDQACRGSGLDFGVWFLFCCWSHAGESTERLLITFQLTILRLFLVHLKSKPTVVQTIFIHPKMWKWCIIV